MVIKNIHYVVVLFICALCLVYGGSNAAAQDASITDLPVTEADIQESNEFADVPDEFLLEAEAFREHCEASPKLSRHYNCECMELEYLDLRIASGTERPPSSIILAIERSCYDMTNAAGAAYMSCMGMGEAFMPPNVSAEEYCTCFVKTYTRAFERVKPRMGTRVFSQMKGEAMASCSARLRQGRFRG